LGGRSERISTDYTRRETREMSKRALIYARVSKDDRGKEGRNLKGQIEDGRAYAQDKGYRIVAELAEDDRGASGAEWNLPKLNQALDMARAGELDVFVTRELDRFARGLAKQLVMEGEFKRHGVEVEYILGEYDDTPEGKLNKHIRAVIAEFEREKINQRMVRGRRQVVKSGKVMLHGDRPPYGYRVEDGMLIIYEPEARIVRLIFTWYVYGDENRKRLGMRAIANRLTGMKVPTWADIHKNGFKKRKRCKWNTGTLGAMLSDETYAGTWHYGKRGKAGKVNPRDHWLTVEVPAIVSRELWEAAQEQRARNKEMAKRNNKHDYLVGRRVTCGECGSKMVGRPTTSGNGKKYLYYYCPAKMGMLASKQCGTRYFNAKHVDVTVWEWAREILLNPEALRASLKEQQAEQERANQPLRNRLAVIDDLLTDNRRQLEKLLDLYLAGDFDKVMLTERKNRLETTITALEQKRADLVTTLEAQTLTDDKILTIESFAREVAGGLAVAEESFEARRHLIDLLDVQVTLAIEEGQRVVYVRCLVDETALSIESPSTGTICADKCNPLLPLVPDT
jgi:site-specific DNA recombinase